MLTQLNILYAPRVKAKIQIVKILSRNISYQEKIIVSIMIHIYVNVLADNFKISYYKIDIFYNAITIFIDIIIKYFYFCS